MSSKLILIISSYTVSKLVHFLRHSVYYPSDKWLSTLEPMSSVSGWGKCIWEDYDSGKNLVNLGPRNARWRFRGPSSGAFQSTITTGLDIIC